MRRDRKVKIKRSNPRQLEKITNTEKCQDRTHYIVPPSVKLFEATGSSIVRPSNDPECAEFMYRDCDASFTARSHFSNYDCSRDSLKCFMFI